MAKASAAKSSRRAERRALRQDVSRTQVLDAAEEVFGQKGFHEATLKEVAELAEFSTDAAAGLQPADSTEPRVAPDLHETRSGSLLARHMDRDRWYGVPTNAPATLAGTAFGPMTTRPTGHMSTKSS